MGGSGSGGGGGSSGTVDYPSYMKERHQVLYDNYKSQVSTAISRNPYASMVGYSPENMKAEMDATIDYFDHVVHDWDPVDMWQQLVNLIPDKIFAIFNENPNITLYLESAKDRMRDNLEDEVLPKYRRGMQNIGAVMTSSFKIGEALLWAREQQEEARLEAEILGKTSLVAYDYIFKSVDSLISLSLQQMNYIKDVIHYNLEVLRMYYSAMKEYIDGNNIYKIESVKWPLEMNKYLMDCLGSIASSAGVSYQTSTGGSSRVGTTIGGALSGAATGAAIGSAVPGIGTVLGAGIGGLMGLVSGLFS